ncbi:MAG: late competence development ComFB family protein, partial [Oscillospiraceae bacterium]|nr:late competence development ComFB family protein [Oscillospiraceae bacterium]
AADIPAAPVPPIVTSMAPDAAVSVQIRNALEDALEGELGAQQPAAPAPVQPDPSPAPIQTAPVPAPEPEPIPVQPEPVEAAPVPEPEPPAPEPVHEFIEPENPGYINVMQVLVEEKAPKYVEMFGLCTCKRCMEDVKAYTLNHLPPKYVVLEPNDRVPRLTVYEGKFSSDITAQLLQACKVVMGTPHHSRA